jgi:hypothetical protein
MKPTQSCPIFIENFQWLASHQSLECSTYTKKIFFAYLFSKWQSWHTRSHGVGCSHLLPLNAAGWTAELLVFSIVNHRQLQNHENHGRQNQGCPEISFDFRCHAPHALVWGYYNQYQYTDVEPLTFKDGSRVHDSIWDHGHECRYRTWTLTNTSPCYRADRRL